MIQIKRIDEQRKQDLHLANEPFSLWGKMIPGYDGQAWSYKVEKNENGKVSEMVFPDENYDFEALTEEHFFVGAYKVCGECVGLAVYKQDCFKYLYLEDLKVMKAYRGQGIGALLLNEGKQIALEKGYQGVYTIGQDNNLSACLFYIKSGFAIGGLNTHVYRGTNQADKKNIYFYLDF